MNELSNSIFKFDVLIGLAFVYLLLAMVCMAVNEWLSGWTKLRSKTLASAIKQLLDAQPGPGGDAGWLLQKFYEHPLIAGMLKPGTSGAAAHPSYLPSRTFATTVMNIVTAPKPGKIEFPDLEIGINALPDGNVKKALLALIQNAGNLDQAQKNIETWFDDTMDRASGWFKRRTHMVTVLIAIFITVLTNADTLKLVRTLWLNPTQRALLLQQAEKRVADAKKEDSSAGEAVSVEYKDKNNPLRPTKIPKPSKGEDLAALGEILGWSNSGPQATWVNWPERLLGWFFTIVAVSLGAPFWFDTLNKLFDIRNAGKKPKTSEQTSADSGSTSNKDKKQGAPNAQPA
jgi:hypothetical protein